MAFVLAAVPQLAADDNLLAVADMALFLASALADMAVVSLGSIGPTTVALAESLHRGL